MYVPMYVYMLEVAKQQVCRSVSKVQRQRSTISCIVSILTIQLIVAALRLLCICCKFLSNHNYYSA